MKFLITISFIILANNYLISLQNGNINFFRSRCICSLRRGSGSIDLKVFRITKYTFLDYCNINISFSLLIDLDKHRVRRSILHIFLIFKSSLRCHSPHKQLPFESNLSNLFDKFNSTVVLKL